MGIVCFLHQLKRLQQRNALIALLVLLVFASMGIVPHVKLIQTVRMFGAVRRMEIAAIALTKVIA
jgi:hypothetical protein